MDKMDQLKHDIDVLSYLLKVSKKVNAKISISGDSIPEISFEKTGDCYKIIKTLKVDLMRELSKLEKLENERTLVYCDGSCYPVSPNGHMGLGILVLEKNNERHISYYAGKGSNNRSELLAAIMAIRQFKKGSKIKILSDSQYVVNGINDWIYTWIRSDWKRRDDKAVSNIDDWKVLYNMVKFYDVEFEKIKGHQGIEEHFNYRADKLASNGAHLSNEERKERDINKIFNQEYQEYLKFDIYEEVE